MESMTRIIIIRVNFREVVFVMFLLTTGRYGTVIITFYSNNNILKMEAEPEPNYGKIEAGARSRN